MAWPSAGDRAGCCQRERRPSLLLGERGHFFQARYFVEDDEINIYKTWLLQLCVQTSNMSCTMRRLAGALRSMAPGRRQTGRTGTVVLTGAAAGMCLRHERGRYLLARWREAAGGQPGFAEVISLSLDEEVDKDAVVELVEEEEEPAQGEEEEAAEGRRR
ncbi:hypothetical protein VPH35_012143 [Triticum aestivum]